MVNVLSIDVEEYFHATEVQKAVGTANWSVLSRRVDRQTDVLLEMLDIHKVRATFFVLGWVAKHDPNVVRNIVRAGHEIGCHSYAHELVYTLKPAAFRADLKRAVAAIEDAAGVTPLAFRAPSYSITAQSMWALEALVESGFTHDSSIFPIQHDRYGIPGFSRHAGTVSTPSGPIYEVPIATAALSKNTVTPVGGGAYLRLLPYRYTAAGIRLLNNLERQSACIYLHPWELDSELPRVASGLLSRLRTYCGLASMKTKLERLLTEFQFSTLSSVHPFPSSSVSEVIQSTHASGEHDFASRLAV